MEDNRWMDWEAASAAILAFNKYMWKNVDAFAYLNNKQFSLVGLLYSFSFVTYYNYYTTSTEFSSLLSFQKKGDKSSRLDV